MGQEVVWTDAALRDLDVIVDYIARDDFDNALNWMLGILDLAESLSEHSGRGRTIPEWKGSGVRELVHGNYRLIYRQSSDAVQIIAVLHSRREFYRAFPQGFEG